MLEGIGLGGGGTILFDGMLQPGGKFSVTARPDPTDRSRSDPRDWDVGISLLSGHAVLNMAPSGTMPCVT